MIRRVWNFLSEPKNLALMSLLGGALAFFWKVAEPRWFVAPSATRASASSELTPPTATPIATATRANQRNTPEMQRAEASNGGNAVNAGDNATITITR